MMKNIMINSPFATKKVMQAMGLSDEQPYEPCADDWMTTYLNRADVKTALHVKSDITWADCSRSIHYQQSDGAKDITPIYSYLIDNKFGLDILVYSGDDDSVCGTIGTQAWIWDLGYPVAGREWVRYESPAGQTGGYLTKFKGAKLAFATVHGAGHEGKKMTPITFLTQLNNHLNLLYYSLEHSSHVQTRSGPLAFQQLH